VSVESFGSPVIGSITPGGSGASRNIQVTPNGTSGKAPIVVTVTDADGDSTATWFLFTSQAPDQPPVISPLIATNTLVNTTLTIPFTISDDHTAASSLYPTLTKASGNQTLVPNVNISFGGSGGNPTIIVTPVAGQTGVAPITISVNDGVNTSTATFTLMVRSNTAVIFTDSFDYDTSGNITVQSTGLWTAHSSANSGPIQVGSGVVTINGANSEDINAPLIGAPYTTNSATVLYSSFKVNFSALPTLSGTYFAHFKDDTIFGFMGRVWASTLNAASGSFRIGIGNGTGATNSVGQFPLDLSLSTTYTIVTKLDISNAVATIWINPATEADTHVTDPTVLDPTNRVSIFAYALRQSGGEGTLAMDDLRVGTSFTAVTGLPSTLPTPPNPTISSFSIIGGEVVMKGTNNNGTATSLYRILSSTNVALPLSAWTPLLSNSFSANGTFSFTNGAPTNSQLFYLLQVSTNGTGF
jgi:hypothetical protein